MVFLGFCSVISAMNVLLVEFYVLHINRVMGTAVLSCSILEDDNQCISNSSSSLCQNAAFTRCRSENGYRPEQIHLLLAES